VAETVTKNRTKSNEAARILLLKRRRRRLAASGEKECVLGGGIHACDKDLKFDPELYKDLLAVFEVAGRGWALWCWGRLASFRRFRLRSGKKIAETALKNRNGLNIIVGPGASNFPETIELSKHAEENGADGLLIVPPFLLQESAGRGAGEILFDDFRAGENSRQSCITSRLRAVCRFRTICCIAWRSTKSGRELRISVDDAEVVSRFGGGVAEA